MKKLFFKLITFTAAAVMLTSCEYAEYEPNENNSVSSVSVDSESESISESEIEAVSECEPEFETVPEAEPVTEAETAAEEVPETADDYSDNTYVEYHFRTRKQLEQHFEKHGGEFAGDFSYETAEDYEKGASDLINNPDALYKTEAEDGDGVYYFEATNEFAVLSTDGYIRTYFRPNAGIDYFNRQ